MQEMIGQTWLVDILTALTMTDGLLDGVKVHLFTNDIQLTPDVLVADLVEADYSGYAASTEIVWAAPFLDALGRGVVVGDNKQFQPTGSTVTNNIYGYWIMPTTPSTTPIKIVKFSTPVPMTGVLSALIVTPQWSQAQP